MFDIKVFRWSKTLSPSIFLSASVHNVDINWREKALGLSRQKSCKYALIMESNAFLMQNSLKKLMELDKVVVAPLLNSPFGLHSNVYGLLDDDFVMRIKTLSQRVCI